MRNPTHYNMQEIYVCENGPVILGIDPHDIAGMWRMPQISWQICSVF